MIGSGRLVISDVAIEVAELITKSVVPARIKPIWKFVAFAAVGTLDPRLRDLYGFTWTAAQQRWLDMNLGMIKTLRPLTPRKFRWILPARWAQMRLDHPPLVA